MERVRRRENKMVWLKSRIYNCINAGEYIFCSFTLHRFGAGIFIRDSNQLMEDEFYECYVCGEKFYQNVFDFECKAIVTATD